MITAFDDRASASPGSRSAPSRSSRPALPARILHLADSQGTDYYAKQHQHPARFVQELRAYQLWTRHLAAATPRLIAHHEQTLTLLISAVPGLRGDTLAPGSDAEGQAYRDAGPRSEPCTTPPQPPPTRTSAARWPAASDTGQTEPIRLH
ncbi:hypothetical protein GXW82_33825 [Streptacidiphilus sp. 4-A2]|nr:hypothetical protein [Streptacidiphilus sp. 4-A2]